MSTITKNLGIQKFLFLEMWYVFCIIGLLYTQSISNTALHFYWEMNVILTLSKTSGINDIPLGL